MLQVAHVTSCTCYQLHMWLVANLASWICCQLQMLQVAFVASCTCPQLHMLPTACVASYTCCQLIMMPVANALAWVLRELEFSTVGQQDKIKKPWSAPLGAIKIWTPGASSSCVCVFLAKITINKYIFSDSPLCQGLHWFLPNLGNSDQKSAKNKPFVQQKTCGRDKTCMQAFMARLGVCMYGSLRKINW